MGDQARPLPGGEQCGRYVGVGLRRLPVQGRRQDGNRRAGPGELVVRVVAPYNSPKLVVVANVEHGGFGVQAAAPIAKKIYAAYFHLNG